MLPFGSPEQKEEFNYASLKLEARVAVQQRTGEIKERVRRNAQDIIEIGEKLIEVKDYLGHGQFGEWLAAEFAWGEWTARKFMQVAQKFKLVTVTDLDIDTSALYLLASSSIPEQARVEALKRATQGEPITKTKAKEIVNRYKPQAPANPKATKTEAINTLLVIEPKPSLTILPLKVVPEPLNELVENDPQVTTVGIVPISTEVDSLTQSLQDDEVTSEAQLEEVDLENETAAGWRYGDICQWQGELGKIVQVEGDYVWVDLGGRTRKLSTFDIELPGSPEESDDADQSQSKPPEKETSPEVPSLGRQTFVYTNGQTNTETMSVSNRQYSSQGADVTQNYTQEEMVMLNHSISANTDSRPLIPLLPPDIDLASKVPTAHHECLTQDELAVWVAVTPYVTSENLGLHNWSEGEVQHHSAELKRITEELERELEKRH